MVAPADMHPASETCRQTPKRDAPAHLEPEGDEVGGLVSTPTTMKG
jgi:hypothetical protein